MKEFYSMFALNWLIDLVHNGAGCKRRYHLMLTLLFFLIIGYFFLTWPIIAYDTDLWYHLSGGRYFFANGHIAQNSYFSFLSPTKIWHNYYWLFQVIVYAVFSLADYYGLIILRCLLFLATLWIIYLLMVDRDQEDSRLVLATAFFITLALALTTRVLLVRPHLFSYFFIVLFLYILEKKRAFLWLLPLLGVLWSNIHGIEYPVMILILIAYLTEMFWREWRDPPREGNSKHARWFLIVTCYTILCTPWTGGLLPIPFESSYGASRFQYFYIQELQKQPWDRIFTFSVFPLANIMRSLLNGALLAAFASFLFCVYKRNIRISHLILFMGGFFLLFQHVRFEYEFLFLSLPLVRHTLPLLVRPAVWKKTSFYPAMSLLLIILPLLTYGSYFKNRPGYPCASANLPTGVVAFLNHVNVGGSILNDPDSGGYLHWSLNNNYRIAMDFQMSIFGDEDYAAVSLARRDEHAFRKFINKYQPPFVTAKYYTGLSNFINRQKQYVPVFLDDYEILFVNRKLHPMLAEQYLIKDNDLFNVAALNIDVLKEEKRLSLLREATKMLAIDKANAIANWLAGNIAIMRGNYSEALRRAETIIHAHGESSAGYSLKANALREMGDYPEAARHYRMAIARESSPNRKSLYRNLFVVYTKQHKYRKAYNLYKQVVNPFAADAGYQDIYELALAAAAAGKPHDARTFLNIALLKAPPEHKEYDNKIKAALLKNTFPLPRREGIKGRGI